MIDNESPHAVYTLYDHTGALLYVGMTSNLEQRLRQHKSKGYDPERTAVEWVRGVSAAAKREDELIRKLKPPLNGTFGRPKEIADARTWLITLPADLKAWALDNGGAKLVRELLERERERAGKRIVATPP